jgi:mono/diheme cytochrome c family protein
MRTALLFAGAILVAPSGATAQSDPADPGRTTLDGVYSTEQAARGKETYIRVCSSCHVLDWYKGDVVRAWEGATLYGLFEVISTTMPEDNPGSLNRRAYVEMLAYILELNGLPAGEEPLSSRRSQLNSIRFQFEKEEP